MPTRPNNTELLTKIQIDVATSKGKINALASRMETMDDKIDVGFENLKGYVSADIYKLHMEAQKIVNDNHEGRLKAVETFIENNNSGIKFSNDIVKNILKTIAVAAGACLVIAAAYVLVRKGGGL